MVDCGAGLGLRIGEVLGLAAEDVDWLRHTVHVRRQLMRVSGRVVFGLPKGSKERKVPLPDSVALVLSEHIRRCPPVPVSLPWQVPGGKLVAAGLLFSSVQGKAVEQVSWRASAWYPAIRAAGFEAARDTGFHQLRHHYASRLLAAGIDVRTLASALGHADPAVTLRVYSHLMPDAADRIRAAIDSGASGQASGDTHTATAAGTAISHGTVTALERKTLV
jgi:integrase